jgi:hypothetical protein
MMYITLVVFVYCCIAIAKVTSTVKKKNVDDVHHPGGL